jgi:DEAD/DEAH box helicase domain-containing protein
VHVERLPARPATCAELARPLPPVVRERLGIEAFWSHQAEAIDLIRDRQSVAIATGTASGKSLCYQAPIAESVVEGSARPPLLRCLTKALAQDQLRSSARSTSRRWSPPPTTEIPAPTSAPGCAGTPT